MNWEGYKFHELKNDERYNKGIIVKKLRTLFKERFPKEVWKFSIVKQQYSTIRIKITKAPKSVIKPEALQDLDANSRFNGTSVFIKEIQNILEHEANAFNYDNSDGMYDYFDRGYYLTWEINTDSLIEPQNATIYIPGE